MSTHKITNNTTSQTSPIMPFTTIQKSTIFMTATTIIATTTHVGSTVTKMTTISHERPKQTEISTEMVSKSTEGK